MTSGALKQTRVSSSFATDVGAGLSGQTAGDRGCYVLFRHHLVRLCPLSPQTVLFPTRCHVPVPGLSASLWATCQIRLEQTRLACCR